MTAPRKTIGEINGRWQMLFKAALMAFPLIVSTYIPWMIWVTNEIFAAKSFRENGATKADLVDMERRLDSRVDSLPPPDWRDRINAIDARVAGVADKVQAVEKNQVRILTTLERIEKGH